MATPVQHLRFPPFRLDVANNLLWWEEYHIPLCPKVLAVLQLLIEKADDVVSRDELFLSVWEGTIVSDNVLKVSISEIRKAAIYRNATKTGVSVYHLTRYASLPRSRVQNRGSEEYEENSLVQTLDLRR